MTIFDIYFILFLQLGLFLKKVLKVEIGCLSKSEFLEIIERYLRQRTSLVSSDLSTFCICGGKQETVRHIITHSSGHSQIIDIHQNQLQVNSSDSILQYLYTLLYMV